MKIWVDADACPVVIRDIIYRAAKRTGLETILVANAPISVPESALISFVQVPAGLDVADQEIVQKLSAGDLVITSDIPLAAEVIENGGQALSPRGELFTAGDIRNRLSIRDFMNTLRATGVETGGPPPMSQKDSSQFANQFDKFLTAYMKSIEKKARNEQQ